MQSMKWNELTNQSNERQTSIEEEMEKLGFKEHSCSLTISKQAGYEAEAQLLVAALNLFDHLGIPVQLEWNTGWLRRAELSAEEAEIIFEKTGIAHLLVTDSTADIQSSDEEMVIFSILNDTGESLLARSVYVSNASDSAVKLNIDLKAIEKLRVEQVVANRAEQAQLISVMAAPQWSEAASRAAAELEGAGIAARTIYPNEIMNELTLRYAIRIESVQSNEAETETGLMPITLIDHAQRTETRLVLDQCIHVLTQLLL
ncbi:hypothetical protein ACFSVM_07820 [Paenibacillus shunpengii]|uniref:Uncharacterized protein n=1 Tax=Paenibacillus shunpengii TaxID=2054424 RepID=A0ABW5SKU4_9BACL|nr:hypothetical protein [Paenibacillus sp. PDC88]SDW07991.1 hypothetical protein SAMN05518848_101188 [Paenibacillus sp. PDC88]